MLPLHDPARNGLHAGDEREMVRRLVHGRLSTAAVKPWKGPLPKVSLPDLTVFDLIRPESWIVVNRKKKSRRTAAKSTPTTRAAVSPVNPGLGIAASRQRRLNSICGREGPSESALGLRSVGPGLAGYEAQANPVPNQLVLGADRGLQAPVIVESGFPIWRLQRPYLGSAHLPFPHSPPLF